MGQRTSNGVTCFTDVETGGLRADTKMWEVGLVREDDTTGEIIDMHLMHVQDFRTADADPQVLADFGFYDRHPAYMANPPINIELYDTGVQGRYAEHPVQYRYFPEITVAARIEYLSRWAHVAGCNIPFDLPIINDAIHRGGFVWQRFYKATNAYDYAAGVLGMRMPADSKKIIAALGVDREAHGPAHNALIDALYARDVMHAAYRLAGNPLPASA